jgi:uncharacterized protein (DUF488 family)
VERTVATIGYEQATLDAVLGTLRPAGVGLLVDVRAVAASRRPGFSKRQLAAGAEAAGIGYLHLRGLGTPAEGRLAARAGRHAEMRRIFGTHLLTAGAQAEMGELTALVAEGGRRVCLLCFERHPEQCHRAVVADELVRRLGVRVEHLLP